MTEGVCVVVDIAVAAVAGIGCETLPGAGRLSYSFFVIVTCRVGVIVYIACPTSTKIRRITLFRAGRFGYFLGILTVVFNAAPYAISYYKVMSEGVGVIVYVGRPTSTKILGVAFPRASRLGYCRGIFAVVIGSAPRAFAVNEVVPERFG